MRRSVPVLLHLLLAVLLAFDGTGAVFAAVTADVPGAHPAQLVDRDAAPPCHGSESDADTATQPDAPLTDPCCAGGDCLCLHGCGSVLPVVPRIAASTGCTAVVPHVPVTRAAPRLDDPVRPPIRHV